MNYRRGLTRLYLVLWVLWVVAIVIVLPEYLYLDLTQKSDEAFAASVNSEFREATRTVSAQQAVTLRQTAHDHYDWGPWFRNLYDNLWLTTIALVAFPAVLYGLLFVTGATAAWVVRGFRGAIAS